MSDEHFADILARRLARASGRRAVLAAITAGLAATAGIGVGPGAEAGRRRRRRTCRTRSDCKIGQACVDRRC